MLHKVFLFALGAVFAGGALTLIVQLFFVVPYGRHSRRGWGPALPAVSSWMVIGFVAPAAMGILYVAAGRGFSDPAFAFLGLWIVAYLYRGGVYPWAVRTTQRRFPAILVLAGIIVQATGGFINGYFLFLLPFEYVWADLLTLRRLAGLTLFLLGFFLHLRSDLILAGLRRTGSEDYQIPREGPFRFMSSPNYLGATLQWVGWAVLVWNLPGLAVAWLTFAFLFPRAIAHHKWYKRTFPDYPKTRKAFFPFVL